jgi:ribosomal protein S25
MPMKKKNKNKNKKENENKNKNKKKKKTKKRKKRRRKRFYQHFDQSPGSRVNKRTAEMAGPKVLLQVIGRYA